MDRCLRAGTENVSGAKMHDEVVIPQPWIGFTERRSYQRPEIASNQAGLVGSAWAETEACDREKVAFETERFEKAIGRPAGGRGRAAPREPEGADFGS
jgi:hypothetical protein